VTKALEHTSLDIEHIVNLGVLACLCPRLQTTQTDKRTEGRTRALFSIHTSVREYVFYVFFSDFKKRYFLRFLYDLSRSR